MESFWTDTPFGITLLASFALTTVGSIVLVLSTVARLRTSAHTFNHNDWPVIAAYLFGYCVIITVVTYVAIVVYYFAGSIMGVLSTYLPFVAAVGTPVWLVMQIIVVGSWLGAAFVIFRRMFQQWL